jgi:glutamate carboxypeptidase
MGTTLNIGIVKGGTSPNVVAEDAQCQIDIRITDINEAQRIESRLRELQANPQDERVSVAISGGLARPPLNTTAQSLALCERVSLIGRDLGIDIKWVATGGGSDGNFTSALGIPTIDGMGPIGGNTHAATEYAEGSSFVPRFELLFETVKSLVVK